MYGFYPRIILIAHLKVQVMTHDTNVGNRGTDNGNFRMEEAKWFQKRNELR
jgi:hypothetical protein